MSVEGTLPIVYSRPAKYRKGWLRWKNTRLWTCIACKWRWWDDGEDVPEAVHDHLRRGHPEGE